MKRWILLLCCILLALSVTGCTGENSSSDSSSEPSSSQTQLQEDPVDPETAAALELVAEADCEAPDFLTEEQQTLYRKARTAYAEFTLVATGFGTTEWTPVTIEGNEEGRFFVGDGSITTWKDFETAMLGLFTPDYLEALNININVLGMEQHTAMFTLLIIRGSWPFRTAPGAAISPIWGRIPLS